VQRDSTEMRARAPKTCREPFPECGSSTTEHSQPLPRCPPTTSTIIAAAHIYTSQIALSAPLLSLSPIHSRTFPLLANHVLLFVYFRFFPLPLPPPSPRSAAPQSSFTVLYGFFTLPHNRAVRPSNCSPIL
jgi:hypothetical protein